jgi:lysophospholipase L1-like esterase
MQQILVYGDSLSWGIIPDTRERIPFKKRWPIILEQGLVLAGHEVRVIEDCLNGRRTVWEDPFKPGRRGVEGLSQRIEVNSPLSLVIIMLGSNDLQTTHHNLAWQAAQGMAALVNAIRTAPIEPTMPIPQVMIVSPPMPDIPKGDKAPWFEGSAQRGEGMSREYAQVASELDCAFFDADRVVQVSPIDGVHLDADQHQVLAEAICEPVSALL